ncbi:MAG: cell division topological specificity factor MinE [Desulfatibacillaceae bacterium]
MLNNWLKKISGKGDSREVAKKRLRFALVYDKLEVSEDTLERLQEDLIAVISRYFEFDRDGLKLDIERHDDFSALVFNAPIVSAKRRRAAQAEACAQGSA